MEKFDFSIGEGITFVWRFTKDELTPKHCTVSEIEKDGIWVEFDDEPENEYYIVFEEMHLFIRDGSNKPEGTKALQIDEITRKFFNL